MQMFIRQCIAGSFHNRGRGKYTRNAENKKLHFLKGINNVKSDARYSVNIQLYSRYSKFQAEIMCITLRKTAENVSTWYIENDSWKMPTDLFYAYPGSAHHEDAYMLIVELFFHLLHPGRYSCNGRVPTLQDTEF
jgi:hypothetical protein